MDGLNGVEIASLFNRKVDDAVQVSRCCVIYTLISCFMPLFPGSVEIVFPLPNQPLNHSLIH